MSNKQDGSCISARKDRENLFWSFYLTVMVFVTICFLLKGKSKKEIELCNTVAHSSWGCCRDFRFGNRGRSNRVCHTSVFFCSFTVFRLGVQASPFSQCVILMAGFWRKADKSSSSSVVISTRPYIKTHTQKKTSSILPQTFFFFIV